MTRLLAVSLSLAACSGRAPAPTGPTGPEAGSAAAGSGSGTSTGRGSAATVPVDTKVTEAECHAMIDHVIDIDVKERPADQQLGPDQKAEIAAQMRTRQLPTCLQQSRTTVACVTAAQTSAAIKACK